jgi:thiol-disulfide isomerase/thioredoxin
MYVDGTGRNQTRGKKMADSKPGALGPIGIIVVVLLVLGVAMYVMRVVGRSNGLDGEWPPTPTGQTMDYDWTVQDLEGQPFNMTETRGKVLFLNFWATWCPPCVAEMPSIQRLYDRLRGEGVAFALVTSEEAEPVRRFMERNDYTLPVYLGGEWVPRYLQPRAIPTTYIVRPDGKVMLKHTGAMEWDAPRVREFLEKLAETAPAEP